MIKLKSYLLANELISHGKLSETPNDLFSYEFTNTGSSLQIKANKSES